MLYPTYYFMGGLVLWGPGVWPGRRGRLGLRFAAPVELDGLAKVTVSEFSESACLRVRGVVSSIHEPMVAPWQQEAERVKRIRESDSRIRLALYLDENQDITCYDTDSCG